MSQQQFEIGDVVEVQKNGIGQGSIGIVIEHPHPISAACTELAWIFKENIPEATKFNGPFTHRLKKITHLEPNDAPIQK